ncbi:MAG: energy-coupling factor transporter ATPase [Calditrichaeota bacterium]|nr:energy-coupling factor transporter ATPase [Calditrichota bacterium]
MRIRLEDVSFRYTQGLEAFSGKGEAIQHVSFEIAPGEFVGIVGPSGSGKTTLIQHFNGLLLPTAGKVLIDGTNLAEQKKQLGKIRQKIGIIFQFPEFQFFENTIYDEVAYGPRNLKIPEKVIQSRIQEAFHLLDIDFQEFKDRSPFQLSEGQKRRVAIASVLVMQPDVLVFDEPTAGLDFQGVNRLKSFIKELKTTGKTVILVSHDMDFIAEVAERIICLKSGHVIFDGTKETFFSDERLLKAARLKEPDVLHLARSLRNKGIPCPFPVYDVSTLQAFLEHLVNTNFNKIN